MGRSKSVGQLRAILVRADFAVPRLFSYVVTRDYGFAPNPFYGCCTLATCKPRIRKVASIGDWIVGTGSKKQGRDGFLVFAMQVTETMTYNDYWKSQRFRPKRPNLRGSMKQAFGDNIYFNDIAGEWHQQDSHHSYRDGSPNHSNIALDTQTDRVLISSNFVYWGKSGPRIPHRFRNYNGTDICAGRGHKSQFPEAMVEDFVYWFQSLRVTGYVDAPSEWD